MSGTRHLSETLVATIAGGGGGGGGISDAPSDGTKYGRRNAAWVAITDEYIDGEVATHADLPTTIGSPPLNSAYLVRAASGFLWRTPGGVYVRTANTGALTDWTHAGAFPDVFSDANFTLYDDADATKELGFVLGGFTTGTKRYLTPLDKDYTIEETGHASKHVSGGSDAIKLDDLAAPDDNTDLDASASAHGLMPKADKVKLDGIEAAADVTDAANVAAAGALMTSALDTDGTLAANSDAKVATQKATKTYVDALIAASDAMVFKGVLDCSTNPNYPAADRGHTYRASVAGKIGGASGLNVEVGDIILCLTDGTASGDQATVGSAWSVIQTNLDGAVIGPASATDGHLAQFDGVTGKLLKGGVALDTDTTLAADSDTRVATQKAVKAYAASLVLAAASQAEMEAGTEAALRSMSPLRVAQAIAALGGGGAGKDIFDFTLYEIEAFWGGNTATGNFTTRNGAIGSGATLTAGGGADFPNAEIRSGANSGAGYSIQLLSAGTGSQYFDLDGDHVWKLQWLVRTGASVADVRIFFGAVAIGGTITPADGIFFRFDTSLSDTEWQLASYSGSTPTLAAAGLGAIAATTTYTLKMWSTGDGVIRATVNGGTEQTVSTGITAERLMPCVLFTNNTTADKRIQYGRLSFRVESIAP